MELKTSVLEPSLSCLLKSFLPRHCRHPQVWQDCLFDHGKTRGWAQEVQISDKYRKDFPFSIQRDLAYCREKFYGHRKYTIIDPFLPITTEYFFGIISTQ